MNLLFAFWIFSCSYILSIICFDLQLGKPGQPIERFDGTCGLRNLPMVAHYYSLKIEGTKAWVNISLDVKEDITTDPIFHMKISKCKNADNLDSCEQLPDIEQKNCCNFFDPTNPVWGSLFSVMQPQISCPLKKVTPREEAPRESPPRSPRKSPRRSSRKKRRSKSRSKGKKKRRSKSRSKGRRSPRRKRRSKSRSKSSSKTRAKAISLDRWIAEARAARRRRRPKKFLRRRPIISSKVSKDRLEGQRKYPRGTRIRGPIKLIYHGKNVTPQRLFPIRRFKKKKKRRRRKRGRKAKVGKFRPTREAKHFRLNLRRFGIPPESQFRHTFSYGDEIEILPERKDRRTAGIADEDNDLNVLFSPRGERSKLLPMPTHISVILSETPTIWLLDVPSKTVEKDSEDGVTVQDENDRYEYLTVGKGRNRKMVTAEVQTAQILYKTRTTEAERVKHTHNHTFASNWEMYDTYEYEFRSKNEIIEQFLEDELDREKRLAAEARQAMSGDHKMKVMLQNPKFLEAVCVIERLLANNNFNEQQKRFRGLLDPDPFREDIEYKYRLKLLWTYSNKATEGRCVTAMCWNDFNPDILAVAYGKFYYTERSTGRIMLWNVKNPVQPERTFRFENPVTTINFSKKNPNVLAVGFYNGDVKLIDVSARELRVIGNSGKDSPSFESIWQVTWFQGSDYFKNEEQLITTCQDGRVSHFRSQDTVELLYSQIMRIPRPEGKIKGIETLRRCHVPGIPVTRYAPVLVIQQHPTDANIYYVGTSEGTIHKCSRNYYHQHLDMFLAHDGPLYAMKFSPICNKLMLTCGDDWYVRIWADGIVEPLFELSKSMMSAQAADWSPTHSTIVANICGNEICIWDLQRKSYLPQSVTMSPTNSRNTVIQFTPCGRCLVVGDIEGNVNVFALEDMPFPAFFQDDLLVNSIVRNLVTRPDLIRRLRKIGKLNFTKSTKENYFTS